MFYYVTKLLYITIITLIRHNVTYVTQHNIDYVVLTE